jgi:hypothetical protein
MTKSETKHVPPNTSLHRTVFDKVLGRGRVGTVLEKVLRARVLQTQRTAAELSR